MVLRVTGNSVRAVCFLAHGQKCEQWLPAGEYNHGGEVWLDSANNVRAVTLHQRRPNGATFYVRTDIVGQPGVEVV